MAKKILIVDDNQDILNLYSIILRDTGYQVYAEETAKSALSLLSKIPPPDLILLDCYMPQMDGFSFYLQLKARFPEVVLQSKIVAFSNFDRDSPIVKSLINEGIEYQRKITRVQDFLNLVSSFISAKPKSIS